MSKTGSMEALLDSSVGSVRDGGSVELSLSSTGGAMNVSGIGRGPRMRGSLKYF